MSFYFEIGMLQMRGEVTGYTPAERQTYDYPGCQEEYEYELYIITDNNDYHVDDELYDIISSNYEDEIYSAIKAERTENAEKNADNECHNKHENNCDCEVW